MFKVLRQLLTDFGEYLGQHNDKLWVCDEERMRHPVISGILIFRRIFEGSQVRNVTWRRVGNVAC